MAPMISLGWRCKQTPLRMHGRHTPQVVWRLALWPRIRLPTVAPIVFRRVNCQQTPLHMQGRQQFKRFSVGMAVLVALVAPIATEANEVSRRAFTIHALRVRSQSTL